MFPLRKSGIIIIVLTSLMLTGCAYKTHIKQGDAYLAAGNAELAAGEYEKSLSLKSDQPQTRKKIESAQRMIKAWRSDLIHRAREAEIRKLHGLALILYTKANRIEKSGSLEVKAGLLRGLLADTYGFKAGFVIRKSEFPQLNRDIKTSFNYVAAAFQNRPVYIELVENKTDLKDGYYTLSFKRPEFRKSIHEITRTDDYVSGSVSVENPEYLRCLDTIHHKWEDMAYLKRKKRAVKEKIVYYRNRVKGEKPSPDSETWAEHQLRESRARLEVLFDEMDELYDDIHRQEQRLRKIPQTVMETVYDTWSYPVKQHTKAAQMNMTVIKENAARFNGDLKVSYLDEEHGPQPVMDLPGDPLSLPSDNEMQKDLGAAARKKFEIIVQEDFNHYRERFRLKVPKEASREKRANQLVIYALLDILHIPEDICMELTSVMKELVGPTGVIGPDILKQGPVSPCPLTP